MALRRAIGMAKRRRLLLERLLDRELLAADMTNWDNPMDVNADQRVSPIDALVVVNYLGRMASGVESESVSLDAGARRLYPDTNGDSRVTPVDALGVINVLAEGEVVTASVGGTIRWTDTAGGTHALPRARVEILSQDSGGNLSLIATATTGNGGNYKADLSFDDVNPAPNVIVRVVAESVYATVVNPANSDATYTASTTTAVPLVANASIPVNLTIGNTTPAERAFSVHHAIVVGGDFSSSLNGANPPKQTVRLSPNAAADSTVVSAFPGATFGTHQFGTTIELVSGDAFDWDVIIHEYGHAVYKSLITNNVIGAAHSHNSNNADVPSNTKSDGTAISFSEGYATYFSLASQQSISLSVPLAGNLNYDDTVDASPPISDNIETWHQTGSFSGEDNEMSVAATLWDLADAANTGESRDNVALGHLQVNRLLRGLSGGPLDVGDFWEALAASADAQTRVRYGEVFGLNKISTTPTMPVDGSDLTSSTPPTFDWEYRGTGTTVNPEKFRVKFFNSDFSKELFTSPELTTNTYTPMQSDWDMVISGASNGTIQWVVESQDTDAPATPGGALGYYWSGTLSLDPIKFGLLIDDTGSMSEEIDGVIAAMQRFVSSSAASGSESPVFQVLAFKDSVRQVIVSDDAAAVTTAIGGLRASGGGDCPEASGQALLQAVQSVANGGSILIATDAAPRSDVSISRALNQAKAKSIQVSFVLTGDCTESGFEGEFIHPDDMQSASGNRGVDSPEEATVAVSEYNSGGISVDRTEAVTALTGKPGDGLAEPDHGVEIIGDPILEFDAHGNSLAEAVSLSGSGFVNGRINSDGDSDWFTLDLLADRRYVLNGEFDAPVTLEFHSPSGDTITSAFFGDRADDFFLPTAIDGTYALVLSGTTPGSYEFSVTTSPLAGLTSGTEIFSTIARETGGGFFFRDEINLGDAANFEASVFNLLNSTLKPTIVTVNPATVPAGSSVTIEMIGSRTNFVAGSTTLDLGEGITVNEVNVASPTRLTASITVDTAASLGSRNAETETRVGTFDELASGLNVLSVGPTATTNTLLSAVPFEVTAGTTGQIQLQGILTNWDASTIVSLGSGITVETVEVVSPTTLNVQYTIDSDASIGINRITTTTGGVTETLADGIFVASASSGPAIASVSPSSLVVGTPTILTIKTSGINLIGEDILVDAGAGVAVGDVLVVDASTIDVTVTAMEGAVGGFRDLSVNLGGELLTSLGAFFVIAEGSSGSGDGGVAGGTLTRFELDRGNSPRIEVTGNDLIASVRTVAPGILEFSAAGQTIQVGIRDALHIRASGNNNVFLFEGAVIPDDLNLVVNGHGNSVRLMGVTVGDDLHYESSGYGHRVVLDGGTMIRDVAIIKTNEGDDWIAIQNVSIGDDLIIHSRDGSDHLAMDSVHVGDDLILRMGEGDDEVSILNTLVADVADLKGGRGHDVAAIAQDTVSARRVNVREFEQAANPIDVDAVIADLFGDLSETLG